MARNSKGQHDRLITLRLLVDGDPQYWDWAEILNLKGEELVQVVSVEDA